MKPHAKFRATGARATSWEIHGGSKDAKYVVVPPGDVGLPARPHVIDVCSGIGGGHLATTLCGLPTSIAVEMDPIARGIYLANSPMADVTMLENAEDPSAWRKCAKMVAQGLGSMMVASPPCQDYSRAGAQSGLGGRRGNIALGVVNMTCLLRCAGAHPGKRGRICYFQ